MIAIWGQTYKLVDTLEQAQDIKENSLRPAQCHIYKINRLKWDTWYSETTKINGEKIYNYYGIYGHHVSHLKKLISGKDPLAAYNQYMEDLEDEDTVF